MNSSPSSIQPSISLRKIFGSERRAAVLAEREAQSWYLVYLGTRPEARGKGYARKLVEHITTQVSPFPEILVSRKKVSADKTVSLFRLMFLNFRRILNHLILRIALFMKRWGLIMLGVSFCRGRLERNMFLMRGLEDMGRMGGVLNWRLWFEKLRLSRSRSYCSGIWALTLVN